MAAAGERPNVEALVQCAHRFAQALNVTPLSDADAWGVIDEVFFGRKDGWAGCEMGIITREELVDLLLAHLHSELVSDLPRYPDGEPWKRPELRDAVRRALFGS